MNTNHSKLDNVLGYGIRAGLFAAAPLYLLTTDLSLSNKHVQVVAMIYGPPLIIEGMGAVEATIRAIAHLFKAHITEQQQKQFHIDSASVEIETAHKLVRGAILPLNGYVLMAVKINRFIRYTPEGPRSLIQDYYVYHTPFIVTKHTYTYMIKPVAKTTWKVVTYAERIIIVPVLKETVRALSFGYDILDVVGFWTAVTTVANVAASLISAGIGFASRMLRN